MTDTDALTGRIVTAMTTEDHDLGEGDYAILATRVLPIVAEEVRKAKAEALREAARGFFAMSPHITYSGQHVQERLLSRADRIETRRSDEHR